MWLANGCQETSGVGLFQNLMSDFFRTSFGPRSDLVNTGASQNPALRHVFQRLSNVLLLGLLRGLLLGMLLGLLLLLVPLLLGKARFLCREPQFWEKAGSCAEETTSIRE